MCGAVAVRPADETYALLTEACRQGRAVIAAPIPAPISGSPTSFRIVQRPPQPPSTPPVRAGNNPARKADERRATAERRAVVEEEEVRSSLARFQPFVGVAAVSTTKPENEDPFQLRRLRRWSPWWDA